MKVLKWLVGIPVVLFAAFMALGFISNASKTPAERAAEELADRQRCAAAITSSMGTSTRNYTDRQAYDAHVKENCRNYKIPK